VFNFGNALFSGSTGSVHLNAPVVGIADAAGVGGYWLAAADGGVFAFSDSLFLGSMPGGGPGLKLPVVGTAAAGTG
jgi:hypothetical protein